MGLKKLLSFAGIAAVSLALLAGLGLFLLWRASKVVPDFYREALEKNPAVQAEASDKMIQKATVLASDVRKHGRWEALFTEEEVNGWLAVDLEQNHGNALPPEFADPRIVIEPGGLRLACQAKRDNIETVLSIALDAYLAEPSVLGIRIRSVRAGVVPLPLADVLEQIRDLSDRQGVRIRWNQADGDPVALIQLPPAIDGDTPVIIDTLELAEGEIYVAGTTGEAGSSSAETGEASASAD